MNPNANNANCGLWFRDNLVPRACDPREGTRGSGIIHCRKPGILAKIKLRIPFQRPVRFLPETDYTRASRSFPRIAGSGNEIGFEIDANHNTISFPEYACSRVIQAYSGNEIDHNANPTTALILILTLTPTLTSNPKVDDLSDWKV
jgi:hypothetical protein